MAPNPKGVSKSAADGSDLTIEGALLDVDYLIKGEGANIRLTVKGTDGKIYELFDGDFKPYFYLVPNRSVTEDDILEVSAQENGRVIKAAKAIKEERALFGKSIDAYRVFTGNPMNVPRLSAALAQLGTCYENDIPFAKRWTIDKEVVPLREYAITAKRENGMMVVKSFKAKDDMQEPDLNVVCFDIEVYNPLEIPRPDKDPVIMISYAQTKGGKIDHGVITFKKIDKPFVTVVKDERAMIEAFMKKVDDLKADIVVGYNSANFDIRYLIDRSQHLGIDFTLSRLEGDTKIERHGLVDRVKIAGRVHVDMYLVVRFIAIVGTSEYILKLNRYTLKDVYEAISKDRKFVVEKAKIHKLWEGGSEDLETLATYNLNDADALQKVYDIFIPIMFELSRLTYDALSDVCVSTTGQLVEFMLMHSSFKANELIPNRPDDREIRQRLMNPIEGAYVKTPEPGIYDNLAVFDFRGLYPSIIIAHNIDPSSICKECNDYYESPTGVRFSKMRKSIMPQILKQLIEQRTEVKRAYKKEPDNISLGSRSQALKITSNSFYGYLGYARSRWYSRECAGSVTAYGRQYIKDAMARAEEHALKVIYSDTDSIILLLGRNKKEDALAFAKEYNSKLPELMELELEDFYTRGVFVGKGSAKSVGGAKKKYALISETGRIKIRGFELVRRDWSRIARDTQRKVLETILKEGSAQKAAEIVKNVINDLREGRVPISETVISTQIRKGMDTYDIKSPEIAAARKAVKQGLKTKDEIEHTVINFVITKHGNSISEKAEIDELAKDYDSDYYINHQVIPATMRILKELNFNEDELKNLGVQKKLM